MTPDGPSQLHKMGPLDSWAIIAPVTNSEKQHWDLYREIHKALRFALFGVTVIAGATDPADQSSLDRLTREWADVSMVLEGHHSHEDRFCDPLIEVHAADLRDELELAHRASNIAMAGLTKSINGLAGQSGTSGVPLARLYLQLSDFTATYMGHLRFEEERVMPALNAALSDDELADVTTAIRMSVPPPEMCVFIRYMAPSMNLQERTDMLTGMRAAPEEVFELFRSATEDCLTPADYSELAQSLGLSV
jgi:Hemerythrin HHE cation binding domain